MIIKFCNKLFDFTRATSILDELKFKSRSKILDFEAVSPILYRTSCKWNGIAFHIVMKWRCKEKSM